MYCCCLRGPRVGVTVRVYSVYLACIMPAYLGAPSVRRGLLRLPVKQVMHVRPQRAWQAWRWQALRAGQRTNLGCMRAQVVRVYPQLMASEVAILDAARLAGQGEDLTYWQLQAR